MAEIIGGRLMPWRIRRMMMEYAHMTRILLCILITVGSGMALAADPPMFTGEESACARKIREMFPPVILPTSALALDQARVDHREQSVVIPLKEARDGIQAIWFDTNSMAEALDMIRLLRTGKIGAVSVLPLGHRPSTFYVLQGVTDDDRAACRPERVLELLGKCTECEVLEWRSLSP